MLCVFLIAAGWLRSQQERELYQHDFYLNLNEKEDFQNDSDEPDRHWLDDETEEEESVQRDWYDDENQIVMLDDYFVVCPEGRKREGVLFFYLLPGCIGGLTLILIWIYFKAWLDNKKELHQTRLQLWKVRSAFRGRETDPEFPAKLKEVLKLPPGATNRDISQRLPVQDKELQQMIDKYYDKFSKSDS